MMKPFSTLVPVVFGLSLSLAVAKPPKQDPIEKNVRKAIEEYKKENYSTVTENLREMIKLLEEKEDYGCGSLVTFTR